MLKIFIETGAEVNNINKKFSFDSNNNKKFFNAINRILY